MSPNSCVIENEKPRFAPVSEILKISTKNTVQLLKRELEIALNELNEKWNWISLEKIFIQEGVYKKMEKCTTDQAIDDAIMKGLQPFVKNLIREITLEDVHRLRKIPIDKVKDIFENGIILSGGGSEIFGLDIMIEKIFDISVTKANSPIDSVAKGLARINTFLPLKMRSEKNITTQLAKLYESKKNPEAQDSKSKKNKK